MKEVYVILLNYCGLADTLECVASLKKSISAIVRVVVVDNASPDGSYAELKKALPDDVVIKSETNGGFAAGNNIGIKYALSQGAQYIMLLNNDTIVSPDMVKILLEQQEGNDVVVPKIYYYSQPEVIWYAGGDFNYEQVNCVHFGENCSDSDEFSKKKYVNFATGCCLLMTAEAIERVGFWDESYFMYWEDVDYSLRLKQSGIRIQYIPDANLWHKQGASSGKASAFSVYYNSRNRVYICRKYCRTARAAAYLILSEACRFLKGCIKRNNDRRRVRAWLHAVKGIVGASF